MVFNNNLLLGAAGDAGYEIEQSIRFNKSDSAVLSRTPSSTSNRKTFTISFWFKIGAVGHESAFFVAGNFPGGSSPLFAGILFSNAAAASPRLMFAEYPGGASYTYQIATNAIFRDPSAWYHFVASVDTTQSTASDRVKLYVNGELETDLGFSSYPSLNHDTYINNSSYVHRIGRYGTTSFYADGYMAEINFIDGTALSPTSFGETNGNGVWIPKAYSGAYGTNGFYITGATAGDLGEDFSGNNNDFTSAGLTTADQMLDTPTNNFCTWNPLDKNTSITLSEGNLELAVGSVDSSARSTFAASSGKWYWEIAITSSSGNGTVGVTNSFHSLSSTPGNSTVGVGYRCSDGGKIVNGVYTPSYGASYTTGDVIGVALNMDDGEVTFYKNNTSQGVAATGLSGTLFAAAGNENVSSLIWTANFGQSAFTYTPPTGFLELNTANLATPSIKDGSAYFQPTLYTGTGSSQAVSQAGNSTFQPDLVWIKGRSGATEHVLTDAVRGVTKELSSNDTGAEETVAQGLTTFGTAGFTVGTDGSYNTSSATYVGWQWKANGAGSSNTDGTVTSTVSANTTAGFSIVKYAGNLSTTGSATIGHGLGIAPSVVISKSMDSTAGDSGAWAVQHTSLAASNILRLNTTAATSSKAGNGTLSSPTSTVFYANYTEGLNVTGNNYIAYCFAEIPGYSSFGSYTGNGSATDGPFVYTGFKPKWIMYKSSSNAGTRWGILDTDRSASGGGNSVGDQLFAELTNAEANADHEIDFLSNGFKVRDGSGSVNGSGYTITYTAFAENPFGGDGVAPATAR